MSQFVGQLSSFTILMRQHGPSDVATYTEHGTFDEAVKFIVNLYETKLKELNPSASQINYNITDLNKFMDSFTEMSALVCDAKTCNFHGVTTERLKQGALLSIQRP